MTLSEFNFWLDGYSASIKDAPTKEQWETIKEKIKQITEVPIFINHKETTSTPNIAPFTTPAVIPIIGTPVIPTHTITCSNCTN